MFARAPLGFDIASFFGRVIRQIDDGLNTQSFQGCEILLFGTPHGRNAIICPKLPILILKTYRLNGSYQLKRPR
jgi:hypothetical protein